MSDKILNAGFLGDNQEQNNNSTNLFVAPDYSARYDWFVNEFNNYNIPVPEELLKEYELLFKMFGEDEQNKSIEQSLQKFKVLVTDEVPMPEIVLSVCDSNGQNKRMIMTRENISCVTAQAKVGKTFLDGHCGAGADNPSRDLLLFYEIDQLVKYFWRDTTDAQTMTATTPQVISYY